MDSKRLVLVRRVDMVGFNGRDLEAEVHNIAWNLNGMNVH
jgi:hypothetical protein